MAGAFFHLRGSRKFVYNQFTKRKRGPVPDRIEPPILLSRLLTFVFAGAAVVLAVLLFTLARMFPFNRAEVFLLTMENPNNLDRTVSELEPIKNDANISLYKRAFVREYIKARNEIYPNIKVMDKKWNMRDGVVRHLSSEAVAADFIRTDLWRELMTGTPNFNIKCSVEFYDGGITSYRADDMTYLVEFAWFCEDNYGQTNKKDYKIKIRLEYDDGSAKKWTQRLDNPLGIKVAEYTVESGDGDPLSSVWDVAE